MELFSWDKLKDTISEKVSRKFVTGDKATLARLHFAKGGIVPTHHHESEQLTYIIEGAVRFDLEGKQVVVHKGEILLIPSNVPHAAHALEDSISLEVFSPIRTDWLTATK
jgi:quercetin dioxygenase-like cupin family protein